MDGCWWSDLNNFFANCRDALINSLCHIFWRHPDKAGIALKIVTLGHKYEIITHEINLTNILVLHFYQHSWARDKMYHSYEKTGIIWSLHHGFLSTYPSFLVVRALDWRNRNYAQNSSTLYCTDCHFCKLRIPGNRFSVRKARRL